MTDTDKGKVATLTGSLLARKGAATPAGFTRVHAGENDLPASIGAPTFDNAGHNEASLDQSSLDFGGKPADGRAEENWAPLSQIVIRPHPFTSADAPPELVPEAPPPTTPPIGDIGIEPSLLVGPALLLPVAPQENAKGERVTVETPVVSPAVHYNEPILVVPRMRHVPGREDVAGEPADAHGSDYEELAAPTLGPASGGWRPIQEVPDEVPLAAKAEPRLGEPLPAISPARDEPSARQSEERAPREPIALARPAPVLAPVLAPVVAQRTTTRAKVAKPVVVPPIRIGELQARARVIPTRTRRRRRIGPVVFAILALAIFLGVTWQAYRTSRDSGSLASALSPDGEPTIWATVDELGYAVSQILAAIAGRRGPDDVEGSRLAAGADDGPPAATFVPAGPVGTPAQPAAAEIADGELPQSETDGRFAEAGTAEGEVKPDPAPIVTVTRPVSQQPLPAPPVPVAPIVAEDLAAVAPQPVGVTAPPPPPLNFNAVEDTAEETSDVPPVATLPPQGQQEVDTAIVLEPLEAAVVAVAAGARGEEVADDGVAAVAPGSEIAALPVENPAVDGLDDIALDGAGVPVLKPATRLPQQKLGGGGGSDTAGLGDAGASVAGGYAVQLSSLRSRVQAESEFDRLRIDHPALLGDVELLVSEGSVSNRGTFFRVLTSRFSDAGAAQTLCRSLRDRGQDCLVVRR